MENMNKALSEVYDIITHLEENTYKKIPQRFIKMIEKNKDNTHVIKIDYAKSINEQDLLKDTRIILSIIYREYICSSEKKEELKYRDIIELRKDEEVNGIGFDWKKILNVEEEEKTIENNEMILPKQSIFERIVALMRKILNIRRKNK